MRNDQAGRDLDVLLAELVLELPICDSSSRLELPNQCSRYGTPHWSRDGRSSAGDGVELPHFTTDVGAAWRLLEKLAARGAKVNVMNRFPPIWGCMVIENVGSIAERTSFEIADTPALAIWRAVLDALGIGALPAPAEAEHA